MKQTKFLVCFAGNRVSAWAYGQVKDCLAAPEPWKTGLAITTATWNNGG